MSLHYGLELEFFIKKGNKFVPAHKYTHNLDGNPVVGELKTKVYNNLTDCVFELKKLIFKEQLYLKEKGVDLILVPNAKFKQDSSNFNMMDYKKFMTVESNLYGKKLDKLDPLNFRASLQINISDNISLSVEYIDVNQVRNRKKKKRKREDIAIKTKTNTTSYLFDFVTEIKKWDKLFEKEIVRSKRVPGSYCIKNGIKGKRLEYRSLPNNIDLLKLLNYDTI